MGGQYEMAAVVPANNDALLPLVTEDADGSGGKREEPAILRRKTQPACREHPKVVSMGEQDGLTARL
jgi:hypothetical protein